ncbi:hypothetical protein GUJ93_ZPchr0003g17964 [Zizania palustris]|uniref:Uncharacterized protein n=1 Tax=Zizania palustris TaxID=103762 RepID=A0A8J5RXS0_ZIZPA|nr:hypothetical protein GUJ93_ZPchr0003g17964 [Zizania palustris]
MVFLIAATTFTLLKLSGDVGALGWWDLFINYGIAECFAFLVCKRWFNPMIHRSSNPGEASSSSGAIQYRDWESGLLLPSLEDHEPERLCGLPDIGGHLMKIPLVVFQVMLCFLGGGLLMKEAKKSKPGSSILNLLGTTHFVAIHLRLSGKCLRRILQKRRRFSVGFAMRERYAWSYFLAGTGLYASLVLRSARNVQSAVCPLKNACLRYCMLCQLGDVLRVASREDETSNHFLRCTRSLLQLGFRMILYSEQIEVPIISG